MNQTRNAQKKKDAKKEVTLFRRALIALSKHWSGSLDEPFGLDLWLGCLESV
jgi:hypothetical protein